MILCQFVRINITEKDNRMKLRKTISLIVLISCLLLLTAGLYLGYDKIIQSPAPPKNIPVTPPPGTEESSLNDLCQQYGIDPALVIKPLSFKGIGLDADITLEKAAQNNDLTLQALYDMIREASLGQKL